MISMVCRCRDGTYSPRCCKNNSRGRRNTSRRNSRSASPQPVYLGATPGKMATKGGDLLVNLGSLKQAQSLVAQHPIEGKIWTQYTKSELREQRVRTSNTQITRRNKDYDARPERWTGAQKKHQRRRPLTGQYSKARPGQTKMYRAKKYTQATGIKASGYALKGLGYAYYGYLAYQISQEPERLPKLLIQYSPQYALMNRTQQEHAEVTTDSLTESYLSSWARALIPK